MPIAQALTVIAAVFLLSLLAAAAVYVALNLVSLLDNPPFVPIPDEVLPDIVRALAIRDSSVVRDLGCGDGRVLLAAWRSNPRAEYAGVERNLLPLLKARAGVRRQGARERVRIERGDLFKADLKLTDRVFLYLFPATMDRLLPKLSKELPRGARVVACDYPFSDRKADEVIDLRRPGKLGKFLYVYDF